MLIVQSKDQVAASHLEGLVAGPDSSKTRAAEFLLLREWLSHCSPGLTPSSRTQATHMYVRACHARVLCVLSHSPPCAVLVAGYVCRPSAAMLWAPLDTLVAACRVRRSWKGQQVSLSIAVVLYV